MRRKEILIVWHGACTNRSQVVFDFPGVVMSQAFWDGVNWGFAGGGSDSSPFRFLGLLFFV
jgi:hypothetical protein